MFSFCVIVNCIFLNAEFELPIAFPGFPHTEVIGNQIGVYRALFVSVCRKGLPPRITGVHIGFEVGRGKNKLRDVHQQVHETCAKHHRVGR